MGNGPLSTGSVLDVEGKEPVKGWTLKSIGHGHEALEHHGADVKAKVNLS